jgi:hypothetical protein
MGLRVWRIVQTIWQFRFIRQRKTISEGVGVGTSHLTPKISILLADCRAFHEPGEC